MPENPKDYQWAVEPYLADCQTAFDALCNELKSQQPLRDWVSGKVPRHGSVHSSGRVTGKYLFHGIECIVTLGEKTVDLQFGDDGLPGTFDAWRIARYVEDNLFEDDVELEDVQQTLDRMEMNGVVERVNKRERRYRRIDDRKTG